MFEAFPRHSDETSTILRMARKTIKKALNEQVIERDILDARLIKHMSEYILIGLCPKTVRKWYWRQII